MIRILFFVVVLACAVAGTVWLADHPGRVAVEWLGWRIETIVPVLIVALLIIAAVVTGLVRLIGGVVRAPGRWAERRLHQRRRKGYLALTDGLAAAASGEAGKANKLAGRAEKLLGDPALTRVLSAQAAQLTGDAARAHEHYTAMLDRPETAALGLRGLLKGALERGDQATAIDLATRARTVSPDDRGLTETLFDLLVKADRLTEAQALLNDATRRKALAPAEAARRRALMADAQAARALAGGDERAALGFARQAVKADPAFAPASLRLAQLYGQTGKLRRAAAVLERAWSQQPMPDLARAYAALVPTEDPLQRARRMEKLVASRPDDGQSHLALAEASLDAKLWGQARKHLLAAVEIQPTAQTYRSLARLEKAEYNDLAAAQRWLDEAAQAPADPTWLCANCAAAAGQWSPLCPNCHSVDSLTFASPGAAPAVALAK